MLMLYYTKELAQIAGCSHLFKAFKNPDNFLILCK